MAEVKKSVKRTMSPKKQELANQIASDFDRVMRELSIEESDVGKRARLVLRLRRGGAPKAKLVAAVKPILDAYAAAFAGDGKLRFGKKATHASR